MPLAVRALASMALGFLVAPPIVDAIEARAAPLMPHALAFAVALIAARLMLSAATRTAALAAHRDETLKTRTP